MNYHASDSDVDSYLSQLKALVVSLGTSSYSGTENLKTLCEKLQTELDIYEKETNDKIAFLTKRYILVTKMLDSITKKYEDSHLEMRYQGYVTNRQQITTTSKFMSVVNRQIDDTLGVDFRELENLRAESQYLSARQNLLLTYKDYITEMKSEISQLIQKCSS